MTKMKYIKPLFEEHLFEDIAYHGSPFEFDYFSSNMIGRGEGASGWGSGFYFSEDIDDAKSYVEKLERKKGEGRLYKAKIPNKKYFLNLDLEFKHQSKYVQECLLKMPKKYKIKLYEKEYTDNKNTIDNEIDEYTFKKDSPEYWELVDYVLDYNLKNSGNGHTLFDEIKEKIYDNDDDAEYKASQLLYSLGIKGNMHREFHYLNYVVFNEDDIQVIKRTKPRFN